MPGVEPSVLTLSVVVMTVILHPSKEGIHYVPAMKSTIKCASLKSGVFLIAQWPLKERVRRDCSIFTQIVAQYTNRNPWITAVTPWMKKPEGSRR